jgi:hypothetical protein
MSRKQLRLHKISNSFQGIEPVILLIRQGLGWREIREHPNAQVYLSYHKQAKMMQIRHVIERGWSEENIRLLFISNTLYR